MSDISITGNTPNDHDSNFNSSDELPDEDLLKRMSAITSDFIQNSENETKPEESNDTDSSEKPISELVASAPKEAKSKIYPYPLSKRQKVPLAFPSLPGVKEEEVELPIDPMHARLEMGAIHANVGIIQLEGTNELIRFTAAAYMRQAKRFADSNQEFTVDEYGNQITKQFIDTMYPGVYTRSDNGEKYLIIEADRNPVEGKIALHYHDIDGKLDKILVDPKDPVLVHMKPKLYQIPNAGYRPSPQPIETPQRVKEEKPWQGLLKELKNTAKHYWSKAAKFQKSCSEADKQKTEDDLFI